MTTEFQRKLSLVPYAPETAGAVRALDVQISFVPPATLNLRYVLHADPGHLRVPPRRAPERADELWKHTCCEAFIRPQAGAAYHELNFSPSTEWAVYSFESYRKGMAAVSVPRPPEILIEQSAQRLEVSVRVELPAASAGTPVRPATLALAAVVEDENGRLSYWALKHPAAKPDFHHPDAFALEL